MKLNKGQEASLIASLVSMGWVQDRDGLWVDPLYLDPARRAARCGAVRSESLLDAVVFEMGHRSGIFKQISKKGHGSVKGSAA